MKPLLLFATLLLCGLAGFCLFGFLATFEPLDAATALGWRITYVSLGLLSVLGLVLVGRIYRRRSRGADEGSYRARARGDAKVGEAESGSRREQA